MSRPPELTGQEDGDDRDEPGGDDHRQRPCDWQTCAASVDRDAGRRNDHQRGEDESEELVRGASRRCGAVMTERRRAPM
jgi:hypothetical protein